MKAVIIDTDRGIDHAVAIMFALAYGHLQADETAANALNILALAGAPHGPVARGP